MIIDRSEKCAQRKRRAQCKRAILKRILFMHFSRAFWHFAFSHEPPSVDLARIFGDPNDQTNQAIRFDFRTDERIETGK